MRALALRLRQAARSLRQSGPPWHCDQVLPAKIDVLFVSHLLSAAQASQPHDFYFGDAPERLADMGMTAAIALINHSGRPASDFRGRWKTGAVPRILLSNTLSMRGERAIARRLAMESRRLRVEAGRPDSELDRRVLLRAAQEARAGGASAALRMASQIAALVACLKPSTLVTTHEGHAWERVCFQAARQAAPGIRCVGYQHAAVFRRQHAIRRRLSPTMNPDHIVTAGAVGKRQLESSPGLVGMPVSVLGSNRAFPTIVAAPSIGGPPKADSTHTACLVLPEGLEGECLRLFEFSIACAKALPHISFIWRLHPLIQFKALASRHPGLRGLPPNIIHSDRSLTDDFARCAFVLYRGSTAAVQAVAAGLRPIYLRLSVDEMTIDPMHEIQDCIHTVTTTAELGAAIGHAAGLSSGELERRRSVAHTHSTEFFTPLDPAALAALALRPSA
ncbi:MAG: hypothetical protein K8R92_06995 [Planctomycetes bacterium]|nr:hypothetical protein [Planctomycetota bacterium]